MQVTIIGLGLIGGSVARDLRRIGRADRLIGVERDSGHAAMALRLGLVDAILPLEAAVREADLVVLAVPVDGILHLLPEVLDAIPATGVVVDLGSTKEAAVASVRGHARRARYVATHPMAGTENAGPAAALDRLFEGKVGIICDRDDSAPDAVAAAEGLYRALGLRVVHMDARQHDLHAAYISHAPHVVAYALALATLAKERDESRIFELAGGGFASVARVAKSAPDMWVPILLQNRDHVLDAIAAIGQQLESLRQAIADGDTARLQALITHANHIRAVLDRPRQG